MAFRDVVMISIFVFFFGMAFFVAHFAFSSLVDQMTNTTQINSSSQAVSALEAGKDVLNRTDRIVFTVFIGLVLALIITGWFVGGNPIFMGIYVLGVIITVVISAVMANIWDDVSSATVFGGTISSFPITSHILSSFPIYMSIVGFVGLVVMFAKPYFSDAP